MTSLVWLIPIALGMGAVALLAFLWSMRSGQYEDLDGAAERVLLDREEDQPIADADNSERLPAPRSRPVRRNGKD